MPPSVYPDHSLADRQCAVTPGGIAGDVGGEEVGLDAVHVAVGAAIAVELGPVLVPLLAASPGALVPEPGAVDRRRLVEQRVGTLGTGRLGRTSGEQHERVLVAELAGLDRLAVGGDLGVPASVDVVVEHRRQCAYAVLRQLERIRLAGQVCQREHVRHAGRDPELEIGVGVESAVVVEPAKPAAAAARLSCERQDVLALLIAPLLTPGVAHATTVPTRAGRERAAERPT